MKKKKLKSASPTVTRIGAAEPIHTPEVKPNRDIKVLLKTPDAELNPQELNAKIKEQVRLLKEIKRLKDLGY